MSGSSGGGHVGIWVFYKHIQLVVANQHEPGPIRHDNEDL